MPSETCGKRVVQDDRKFRRGGSRGSLASGAALSFGQHCITFLDWDDTILPSSYLHNRGDHLTGAEFLESLDKIQQRAVQILSLALSVGDVLVVTNAEQGWVELSCRKYYPALIPFLERLTVISARSKYDTDYPENPFLWKLHAFSNSLSTNDFVRKLLASSPTPASSSSCSLSTSKNPAADPEAKPGFVDYSARIKRPRAFQSPSCRMTGDSVLNVISVGDSDAERLNIAKFTRFYLCPVLIQMHICRLACMKASQTIRDLMPASSSVCIRSKCIKLCEDPSITDLSLELEMVLRCFGFVLDHENDLDLRTLISQDAIKLVYFNDQVSVSAPSNATMSDRLHV